jgi:hypothetical protein
LARTAKPPINGIVKLAARWMSSFSFHRGSAMHRCAQLYERAVPDAGLRQRRAFDWARPYLAQPLAASSPSRETRALFDESWQWARSPRDVSSLVDTARRAGFNVIVPCVWHGRGAAWPATRGHVQTELARTLGTFDPLHLLIERAHAAGIEVHPWLTVVRREDAQHPEFFDEGTPAGAYDIHRAEFRAFAAGLIQELAERYDIDGVNLDYIRAMGICQSDSCALAYARATGRNLGADVAASSVVGPARSAIEQWQDDTMRALVADIRARLGAARPAARLSVSGHPVPSGQLRALEGRAEVDWQRRGLIDAIFTMEYGSVPRHETIAAVANELDAPERVVWLFANFDTLDGIAVARSPGSLVEYIRYARARVPASGVAVYLRAMLSNAQIDALASGPFRTPATPRWGAANPP